MAKKTTTQLNFKYFSRIFLFIVIIGLIVGYVLTANFGATKGFEMADLENKIKLLEEKNRSLTGDVNEIKSLSRAEERIAGMNLVAVDKVEYIKVQGSVALGR
ncbi:MAG: hypothetical protein ABIF17_05585 [Patescibacteria group bacterium]